MIRTIEQIRTNKIKCKKCGDMIESWKHFVVLDGLLNTIDYIEPVNK